MCVWIGARPRLRFVSSFGLACPEVSSSSGGGVFFLLVFVPQCRTDMEISYIGVLWICRSDVFNTVLGDHLHKHLLTRPSSLFLPPCSHCSSSSSPPPPPQGQETHGKRIATLHNPRICQRSVHVSVSRIVAISPCHPMFKAHVLYILYRHLHGVQAKDRGGVCLGM